MSPNDGIGDEFIISELIRTHGLVSTLAQQMKDHMVQSALGMEQLKAMSEDQVAMHLHVTDTDRRISALEERFLVQDTAAERKEEKRSERRQWLVRDVLVMGILVAVASGLLVAGLLWGLGRLH